MKPFIIGIGSRAHVGKDFACTMLLEEFKVKGERVAFADPLKQDLDWLCESQFGFSAFTQDKSQKTVIRPLLVTYGTHVWRALDSDHWIKRVQVLSEHMVVCVVPDVRYQNEAEWVLKNGVLIDIDADVPFVNDEERLNSPIVRGIANYRLFNDMKPATMREELSRIVKEHNIPTNG